MLYSNICYSPNPAQAADAFFSYGVVPGTSIAEFGSANVISIQDLNSNFQYNGSWSLSNGDPYNYTPFLTARSGEQINAYLSALLPLRPKLIFLTVFNQYVNNDGGFTPDARSDYEPTVDSSGAVHTENYQYLYYAIAGYNSHMAGTAAGRFSDVNFRGQINTGFNASMAGFVMQNGGNGISSPQRVYMLGTGPSLGAYMGYPAGVTYAANPVLSMVTKTMGEQFINSSYKQATIATTSSNAPLIDSRGDRGFTTARFILRL